MLLTTLASLLLAVGVTAIPHEKRDTVPDVIVYAYGTGISGLPILADSNGIAYVSSASATNLSAVSFNISTTGTEAWNATISSTNTTSTTGTFYIVTSSDAYSAAGFVSSNETAPTGAETVGFMLYGSDVVFKSGETLEEQFWAKTTGSSTEWIIYWNVEGTDEDDSVPVTLKTLSSAS